MTWEHPLHPDPDDLPIPPEVSRLMDLQEEILAAAEDAGRPELRAALASLFVCDDVGLVDMAHQEYAWLVKAVRDGVGQVARGMEIDGPEEGA